MVDMTGPLCGPCLADGQYCRASFAFPDERPRVCAKHKQPGMLMRNGRYCVVCRAAGQLHHATHRVPGHVRTHCKRHSLPGMVMRATPKDHRRATARQHALPALQVAPLEPFTAGEGEGDEWARLSAVVCAHIAKKERVHSDARWGALL